MTSNQIQNQLPKPNVTTDEEPLLPPYLAYVGINQAARLVGKGKVQIYRDIKVGKLSWRIEEGGKKLLGIADLDRVYGLVSQVEVTGDDTSDRNRKLPSSETPVTGWQTADTVIELAVLQERVRAQSEIIQRIEREKAETLHRMEQEIQDLRQSRDRLLDQNNRLTLLLPAPPTTPEPVSNSAPVKPSWWKRLFA